MPLPNSTFTVAEAARLAGYSTLHTGKWHLGNFFVDGISNTDRGSPPSCHGFDEYVSTEASGASSTNAPAAAVSAPNRWPACARTHAVPP